MTAHETSTTQGKEQKACSTCAQFKASVQTKSSRWLRERPRVMTCSTTPQQGAGRLQHAHTGKASVPPQTVGFSEKESLGRTRPLFRMTCWSRRIFFSCSSSNCLRASSIRRRSSIIASRSSAKLRCASSNCLLFSARVCSSS